MENSTQESTCPKCGSGRDPKSEECPRCGIIFEKYEMVQRRKAQTKEKEQKLDAKVNKPAKHRTAFISIIVIGIILFLFMGRENLLQSSVLISLFCFFFWLLQNRNTQKKGVIDQQNLEDIPETKTDTNHIPPIVKPVQGYPRQKQVSIVQREETPSAILFTIHIQIDKFDSHQLFCEIDKKGSPWVTVEATHFDEPGEKFQYNARHSRWKDSFETPFWIEKGLQKATRLIREEWNAAKDQYGWEFESRKKKPVTADISTKEVTFTYDHDQLKKLSDYIEVQGTEKEPYQINLQTLSCTCPDFIKRRSGFPEGDIRRVCKHQAQAIIKTKMNTKITDDMRIQNIIRSSQERGFQVYDKCIEVTFNEKVKDPNPFYIFLDRDEDWANVIYFFSRRVIRGGYNMIEKRWAYRSNPFSAGYKLKYNKAIEKAIGSIEL